MNFSVLQKWGEKIWKWGEKMQNGGRKLAMLFSVSFVKIRR